MGDKPKAFTPSYQPILCNVSNKLFAPCCVRECKEPHVLDRYGIGGKCMVSIYVCRKCRYCVKDKLCGAVSCGYGMEQGVQEGV